MGSICFEEKLFWTFLVRKGIVLFDLGKNRADEKDGWGGETISYPFPSNGFLLLI